MNQMFFSGIPQTFGTCEDGMGPEGLSSHGVAACDAFPGANKNPGEKHLQKHPDGLKNINHLAHLKSSENSCLSKAAMPCPCCGK